MWKIYSLLLYICSVSLYLFVRSIKNKVDSKIINFYMFVPGTVILFFVAKAQNVSLEVSFFHFCVIFLTTLIFSFVGNSFSLKALENAPNPGYSLIIQKSYAIYTIFVSYLLFGSELAIPKILAIIVIILFMSLVVIDKKTNSHKEAKSYLWVVQSIFAFLFFGGIWIVSRWLFDRGVNSIAMTFYMCLFNVIIQAVINRKALLQEQKKLKISIFAILILIGFLSTGFNLFTRFGIETAPNIAYVNIVNTSSNAMVTLLATFIFKDELTIRKLIGILGVTAGMIFMILN
jgi:drug/metabolite transporter (DMT)-like permease